MPGDSSLTPVARQILPIRIDQLEIRILGIPLSPTLLAYPTANFKSTSPSFAIP